MSEKTEKKLVEEPLMKITWKYAPVERARLVFNYQMNRIDAHFLPIRTLSIPNSIQLEPTNKCNLKCGMCHRSILPFSRVGEMKFEDFRKIVDPMFPYLSAVWLQGTGEPFLCKDIFKMIRYLKTRYVYVNTVSNATLLNKDLCNEILSSGLDEICFSIDGATAKTYEQIRVGASFAAVTENIRTFTSLLGSNARKSLMTGCFVVAMKDNLHELPDIVDLVHKLGLKRLWVQDVQFSQLNSGFAREEESLRAQAEQDEGGKKQIEHYLKAALKLAHRHKLEILSYGGRSIFDRRLTISQSRQKCTWPWLSAYVTWDGFAAPCCIPSTYSCGNLLQEPFKKIWNNKKYRAFRGCLKSGMLPFQCINCSFL